MNVPFLQEYQAGIQFANFVHFKRWIMEHRQNNRLEDQADEFAGRFLVPPDILQDEYDRFQSKMAAADPSWLDMVLCLHGGQLAALAGA